MMEKLPYNFLTKIDSSSSTVALISIGVVTIAIGTLGLIVTFRGGSLKGYDEPNDTPKGLKPIVSPDGKHWLLGHGPIMPKYGGDEHHDQFHVRMCLQYNTRNLCYYLPIFGRSVTIGDPQMAKQITTIKNLPKYLPLYGPSCYLFGSQSMLISVDDKEWQKKRKAFNPGFAPDFLKSVIGVFCQKAVRLLEKCESDVACGKITNMHQRSMSFTSDVIAQVAFGEDWGNDGDEGQKGSTLWKLQEFIEVIETIRGYLNSGNLLMYFFDWKAWKKERQLEKGLNADMRAVVLRRIENIRESNGLNTNAKDILSLCLRKIRKDRSIVDKTATKQQNQKLDNDEGPEMKELSEEEMSDIVDQLKTFYFAGYDTAASLIAWTVWLLAHHPEECQKLRKEIIRELGDWTKASTDLTSPSYEAIQKCVYLDAVLRETLRLYPTAGTVRYSTTDPGISSEGHNLGPGIYIISHYLIHRHPDNWDNPNDFIPSRFLTGEDYSHKWMPFADGRRNCIGQHFAMLESKIAISAIILHFDSKIVDPHETIVMKVVNRPKKGCRVRLTNVNFAE